MSTEPVAITALVGAILALAVGFGLPVTVEQQALIMAALFAILGVLTRSQVTPAALVAVKDEEGVLVAGPAAVQVDGTPVQVLAR